MYGCRPKTRAGRTTGPHPYVPTRLLENWTARTCSGFLVTLVRVVHYPALGTPEHRGRSRPQPWQITAVLAVTGRRINKRAATVRNRGRLRPTGPDVMQCYVVLRMDRTTRLLSTVYWSCIIQSCSRSIIQFYTVYTTLKSHIILNTMIVLRWRLAWGDWMNSIMS